MLSKILGVALITGSAFGQAPPARIEIKGASLEIKSEAAGRFIMDAKGNRLIELHAEEVIRDSVATAERDTVVLSLAFEKRVRKENVAMTMYKYSRLICIRATPSPTATGLFYYNREPMKSRLRDIGKFVNLSEDGGFLTVEVRETGDEWFWGGWIIKTNRRLDLSKQSLLP